MRNIAKVDKKHYEKGAAPHLAKKKKRKRKKKAKATLLCCFCVYVFSHGGGVVLVQATRDMLHGVSVRVEGGSVALVETQKDRTPFFQARD